MVPLKLDMMVKPLPVLVLFLSVATCQFHSNGKSDYVSDTISAFKHTVTELSRQIEDLKQFQKNEIEIVANLQEALRSVKIENKHLKARVAFLESRLAADFDESNEDQQNKDYSGNSHENRLPEEIEPNVTNAASDIVIGPPGAPPHRSKMARVAGTNRNAVAFYAYLSHNVPNPGADFTVKNDHPVTNIGGGYNPVSGIFTCPKAGVYVFSWSVGIGTNGEIYSELAKNGAAAGYLWTGEHTWAETSEKTLILELTQGDIITIKVERTGNTSPTMWGLRTSFSGYLIPY
ncbi:uncharacterized protein LOC110463838 isoform X2 [Mizuhopecten yessoensis]|uniref:uncharacterized protein LOC110463838 isoform X2 n=1 Tax=Mizuhopecten yessoensis TaxID=6573 RepID=UPI000B45C5C0|nr:uncharacterized protein LOC110463838 isoform X2 [Mizuhopecten yessoensis]